MISFFSIIVSSSAFASVKICRACAPCLSSSKNARVDTFQFPCVEERRPVNELAQRRKRKVVENAHAREFGTGQVFGAPLDRSAPFARSLERDELLARRRMGLAKLLVLGAMLRDKCGLPSSLRRLVVTGTARLASSTCTTGSL